MITCAICKKFARFHSIEINRCTDEVRNLKVECKKHGITEGDYEMFEELPIEYNLVSVNG